ncbi:hypothetical protein FEH62_20585 [Salmonella enterica subsp. enterica serovar Infantis]|nr:hypothetical protein [Salmonella enterica subsp. enterica serovar Infantis]
MGSCAAPSAKGDDKFITTDYLQQCQGDYVFTLTLRQPELFIGCAPAYVNPTPELRRDYF